MITKSERIDRIAALCGMIWFALIIDACYTWAIPDFYRYFVGTFFVFFATIILSNYHGLIVDNKRRKIAFFILVLCFYSVFVKFRLFSILLFFPFLSFLFWRDTVLLKMYSYFKRFVLFYAVLSILIELLVITKLWIHIPCVAVLPPNNFVQESLGLVNYYYVFFIIPAVNTSLNFYRASGPLTEGGHFVFLVGFVYFVEKVVYDKRNLWLLISGFLTLSPNFVVFFALTEGYCSIKQRRFLKPILGGCCIIIGVVILFLLSPQFVKDEIQWIILERGLEENIGNVESDGVMAILDGRVDTNGIYEYDKFSKSNFMAKLIGFDEADGSMVLSDFRWMFLYFGYLGTFLFLLCTYLLSIGREHNLFGICIFFFVLMIFIQRAWILNQLYIWIILYLVVNAKRMLTATK